MQRALHVTDLLDDILPADPTRQEIVLVAIPAVDLEHLGFLMQLSPEVAIHELLQQRINDAKLHRNGDLAFKHVCAGCGREFASNRRQLPGKKMWCGRPECKKVAAAERARDYRDRKTK